MRIAAKATLFLALLAAGFVGGLRYARDSSRPDSTQAAGRILYYRCPMHPQYTSDKPGDASCCGMRLEPVYEGEVSAASRAQLSNLPPGAIDIGIVKQQLVGIRVARVEKYAASHTIRVFGRVTADENRVHRLNVSTDVWIRKLHPPTPGSVVHKDEPLLEFYTTNFYSAASAYLYALNTRDRTMKAGADNTAQLTALGFQVRQAIESLQNLGVADADIHQMEKTRQAPNLVTLRSPANGYVLTRNVELGQWVGSSTELYRIADLAHVWVYADLFEREAGFVQRGQSVTICYQGREFRASMSDVLPQFDPVTRTLKVRFELDNPDYIFRPDMFVDVLFPVRLPEMVVIPAEAVIDSGRRKTVYVERGEGIFEPRQVETSLRFGDSIAIQNGLEPGERIVVSGNFLVDSESRIRQAALRSKTGGMESASPSTLAVSEKHGKKGIISTPTAAWTGSR